MESFSVTPFLRELEPDLALGSVGINRWREEG